MPLYLYILKQYVNIKLSNIEYFLNFKSFLIKHLIKFFILFNFKNGQIIQYPLVYLSLHIIYTVCV